MTEDVLAIGRVLDDYAAAIDTRDFDALPRLFTEDADLDYTSSGGPHGPFDEVAAWLKEVLSAVDLTQHYITNRRIDVDGDQATSHAYFHHPLLVANQMFTVGGTYADRFVRTEDGWRIAGRVQTMTWSEPPLPRLP